MIPTWAVPGTYVICKTSRWNAFSGRPEDVVPDPPRLGKIYTLGGAFEVLAEGPNKGRVGLILAEYPKYAFGLENFDPSPAHYVALFRLLRCGRLSSSTR